MGDIEEYYTTRSSWYYRKQLIEDSPSKRDGISTEIEAKIRSEYCHFIRSVCYHLKLDVIPTASSIMFCHRFYMHQSLSKNDWKTIGTACVFLACKSEDSPHRLANVVRIAFRHEIQAISDESKLKVFKQEKRELIEIAERVVLNTIRFDMNVNHAFRPLHVAMKSLAISHHKHIRKEAWGLVHNCAYQVLLLLLPRMNTSLVVQHKADYIAAGSLCIATRSRGFLLPNNWWQHFQITPYSLSVCIREMIEIICMKKPEYAMHLANQTQPQPVNNPEPVNQTPVSILDSVHHNKVFISDTSSSEKETETKLHTSSSEKETETKLDNSGSDKETEIKLETSSSEKETEAKLATSSSKGINKIDIAKIREAVKKRKINGEKSPVELEVSIDNLDNWVEKKLESGLIVDKKKSKTGEKEEKCDGDKTEGHFCKTVLN